MLEKKYKCSYISKKCEGKKPISPIKWCMGEYKKTAQQLVVEQASPARGGVVGIILHEQRNQYHLFAC